MMSVLEYAQDVNKTVSEILNLCKRLNIPVLNEDDYLDEDAITELDNTIAREEEMDLEYEEELIEKENKKQEPVVNNSKQKKQTQPTMNKVKVGKKELAKKKKEMYKNKEKLISNGPVIDTNVVTYKEGMTIADLAKALDVQASDLIKKLFMLGVLATVNNKVDFDNASLLASEYGKELKEEQIIDETKFEEYEINDKEEDLVKRPAVVTIMGHVDHGKTTL
ncbi:MAG: translation initiation factor IF-2 N-terminal domain-containing protein, partial [Bacilli bacterium]|nr:translation initiation factor IF-2 N-terminal domain-containing protein [Bacilli bacterium]